MSVYRLYCVKFLSTRLASSVAHLDLKEEIGFKIGFDCHQRCRVYGKSKVLKYVSPDLKVQNWFHLKQQK